MLRSVLQEQIRVRKNDIIGNPAVSIDGAFAKTAMTGEVTGLTTALGLPYALIDDVDQELNQLREVDDDGSDTDTSAPSGD